VSHRGAGTEIPVNVFGRALEILDTRGWAQGDEVGPGGQRCLFQAWNEASAELHPWPERWHYRLPGGQARRLRAMVPHRNRAAREMQVLRAACEEVNGGPFRGGVHVWNDDRRGRKKTSGWHSRSQPGGWEASSELRHREPQARRLRRIRRR
jgi:hypothetical protein